MLEREKLLNAVMVMETENVYSPTLQSHILQMSNFEQFDGFVDGENIDIDEYKKILFK